METINFSKSRRDIFDRLCEYYTVVVTIARNKNGL